MLTQIVRNRRACIAFLLEKKYGQHCSLQKPILMPQYAGAQGSALNSRNGSPTILHRTILSVPVRYRDQRKELSQATSKATVDSNEGLNTETRSEHDGKDDLQAAWGEKEQKFRETLKAFGRAIPIEEAVTPPSAWYTSSLFAEYEIENVFGRGWQAVGHANQVEKAGDFFTGRVGKTRYVVCKDERGQLHAFHNVCRHHAAAVASGSGSAHSFVCPYHGWTYGLDGRLQKATRLAGIRNFSVRENRLVPIHVATWGPFVLISLENKKVTEGSDTVEREWLGSAAPILATAGINTPLQHVATREYVLNCNWKVYCDNYLDGGYHVPHAHGKLSACLDLNSYSTTLFERVSIQSCRAANTDGKDSNARVGDMATYAFVYPNFMINRYGPWMDTNLVLPVTASQCRVIFNWFLDPSQSQNQAFIDRSLQDSEVVQDEDIGLCQDVHDGLASPAYDVGRYAPRVEQAMHHFHCLLYDDLSSQHIPLAKRDLVLYACNKWI